MEGERGFHGARLDSFASLRSDLPYVIDPTAFLKGQHHTTRSYLVKKTQQGAAIAVCAIGIFVCLISAGVLISELRKERAARERLEQEAAELRQEVKSLKKITRTRIYTLESAADYGTVKGLAVEGLR